jgi:hypothetical protein
MIKEVKDLNFLPLCKDISEIISQINKDKCKFHFF